MMIATSLRARQMTMTGDQLRRLCEACIARWEQAERERDEARAESAWQPAATAPHDQVCDFWLEWADDVKDDSPLGQSRWSYDQQFRGKRGCWGSVYKAAYWRHLPAPPAEPTTPAPASDGMRKGGEGKGYVSATPPSAAPQEGT